MSRRVGLALGAFSSVLFASACGELETIAKDGYRAVLSFSQDQRFPIAVRGEWQRVEAAIQGASLIKIMRPDLKKIWQIRPSTERILETAFQPTDEIVPGYPLAPGFDPQAYADRFGGQIRKIADAAHGLHPCDRWEMRLPSGDIVTIWVARDLYRLVVRVEHFKRDASGEYQPFQATELLDVRSGAKASLFEKPKGYKEVKTYAELFR